LDRAVVQPHQQFLQSLLRLLGIQQIQLLMEADSLGITP
jgi:hypothetical protein